VKIVEFMVLKGAEEGSCGAEIGHDRHAEAQRKPDQMRGTCRIVEECQVHLVSRLFFLDCTSGQFAEIWPSTIVSPNCGRCATAM
jgi:hypothetical protein